MDRRILIGCYEIPGWGGASTSSYKLFETMRDNSLEVSFANIIGEHTAPYFLSIAGDTIGNPKKLDRVHNLVLEGPNRGEHPELKSLIEQIDPDVILAVGWIAAGLMKNEAPERKLIYLTSGCDQIKTYIKMREIKDFISFQARLRFSINGFRIVSKEEKEAVLKADYIFAHSDMILMLYKYFFPRQSGKIDPEVIWFSEWIYQDALAYADFKKPFGDRTIDVLCVSSDWRRIEKNYAMLKKVGRRCRDLKFHIVGTTAKEIDSATHHGIIMDRTELFRLFGDAKAVYSPSVFDAAPGVLFEASALGCNVVASKNCGNWKLCHGDLLVDPFTLEESISKIHLAVKRPFPDNMGSFLGTNSYQILTETLTVF